MVRVVSPTAIVVAAAFIVTAVASFEQVSIECRCHQRRIETADHCLELVTDFLCFCSFAGFVFGCLFGVLDLIAYCQAFAAVVDLRIESSRLLRFTC